MAESMKTATISESLGKVITAIKANKSFVVEAGAGSGKTQTLVETLKYVIDNLDDDLRKRNQKIICITYTNVAADEIKDRIDNNPLVSVSTIHDFLWNIIKNYQNELKETVLEYNANESSRPIEDLEVAIVDAKIEYGQYGRNFDKGLITHDDVIKFSANIFNKYDKIVKIVIAQYPLIFVDEYQDTQPQTVELILDSLLPKNEEQLVVGFFGDSMQKIYNQGVGKIENEQLEIITKLENYRCSKKVIELLNQIRQDLDQEPAGDNLDGEISFYHCNNNHEQSESNYEKVVGTLEREHGWSFNPTKTKILMLTHRGIAKRLGYQEILETYAQLGSFGREQLTQQDEVFSQFLLGKQDSVKPAVEKLCWLYGGKKYGEFINTIAIEGFKLQKHSDKEKLKSLMDGLIDLRSKGTVKEVMEYVFQNGLLKRPHRMKNFEDQISNAELDEETKKRKEFYDSLMRLPYKEVINFNSYLQEFTPFSTKHGVKGAEYDNVLVVIDDASWNQYKFNDVFSNNKSNQNRYDRTLNLLYVCCSRAKDKLAIVSLSQIDSGAMDTVEKWFGDQNVFEITS